MLSKKERIVWISAVIIANVITSFIVTASKKVKATFLTTPTAVYPTSDLEIEAIQCFHLMLPRQ